MILCPSLPSLFENVPMYRSLEKGILNSPLPPCFEQEKMSNARPPKLTALFSSEAKDHKRSGAQERSGRVTFCTLSCVRFAVARDHHPSILYVIIFDDQRNDETEKKERRKKRIHRLNVHQVPLVCVCDPDLSVQNRWKKSCLNEKQNS